MPLKLDFKNGEKMIINAVVLENVGPTAKLLIRNRANILREKEILSEEDAATPSARVYFSLQCAYMFPDGQDDHLEKFEGFLDEYLKACPSAEEIGTDIREHVKEGELYRALKLARKLIAHEMEVLTEFNESLKLRLEEVIETSENEEEFDGDIEALGSDLREYMKD